MILEIVQSRKMAISAQEAYEFLGNLENFSQWNPWACFDPKQKEEVKDHCYSWQGPVSGEGQMKEISRSENASGRQINYQLEFFKPMKAKAEVWYRVDAEGNACDVAWGMRQNLAFPGNLFAKWIEYGLSNDFELGLLRLENLLRYKRVAPVIEVRGVREFPELSYIGRPYRGKISQIGPAAGAAYKEMEAILPRASLGTKDFLHAFCIFAKGNPIKDSCTAEFAYAIPQELVQKLPKETGDTKEIEKQLKLRPALRCIVIYMEISDFEMVRFAWSKVFMIVKGLGHKRDKSFPAFEHYLTDSSAETKIVEICIPIK